tara:strand:- start:1058 stop:1834 length:777 start_codon:yes stop_codon:yes gene_type:complete
MPSSVADLVRGRPEPWQTCVVQTCDEHLRTLVLLHGFTESADQFCRQRVRQCRGDPLTAALMARTRFVFVQSPTREISCYGGTKYTAWHDYLTDHGGEGRGDVEEVIDERHLAECRARIHRILDDEIALLDGDASRVAIGGQSQGGCTSLDAALTYPRLLGGAFVSFGHLYSCTPLPAAKRELRIWAFHGDGDGIIASSLVRPHHRHKCHTHTSPRTAAHPFPITPLAGEPLLLAAARRGLQHGLPARGAVARPLRGV